MATPAMMTDLQGNRVPIPQGATISPIPAPSQNDGMMTDLQGNRVPIPQGATTKPLEQSAATDTKPDDSFGAAGRFVSGAVNEVGDAIGGAVNAAKNAVSGAIAEPQDASETAIHAAGGQAGLAAYRAANSVVQSAQNLIKAKKDNFKQAATDFVHTALQSTTSAHQPS